MAYQVIDLRCPGCGSHLAPDKKKCEYCGGNVVITSFNSVYSVDLNKSAMATRKALAEDPNSQSLNNFVAMCYLKLKLYDKAAEAFEKAIEDNFDNSETFFNAAVCLLKGKKAYFALGADIKKILGYLNAAIMIEPRGIYHYFLAYIKYDYFERKCTNPPSFTPPKWNEELQVAIQTGLTQADVIQLFEMLQVEMPECLRV